MCHLGKSPTTKLDGYCLVINELYGVVWPCPRMPVTTRIDSDIFWFGSGIPKNTKNTSLGAVTGTGGHTQWIFNYMNCWFFNGVNVRNKNPYMDPMPKNESFGGFKVDHGINDCWVMFNHLLLVMFTHLFYTPEKKRKRTTGTWKRWFWNFGDFSVNYEDCLVSMFVSDGVHTYYVQSPLLKGVAKNHICSPAKPSSWSEVPSKGMLYILSQYNLDGKRFILQLKKVCFDMMCDDVEMQHNLLECTTLTFYFCIFYDSTGWNLLIKHSLF